MKVLYAGDACTKLGPVFIASPFNLEMKGMSHHVWGQPLIDALKSDGNEVTHMTNEQAIADFPRTVEELSQYDVIIISDCECEVLSLYPFWIPGTPLPRTNRLKAIREFTRQGGGLLMIGGWTSFSGRFGHGGYYDTPVEEALPVNCLKGLDDRVETPEGATVRIKKPDHPIVRGIPWEDAPLFEGFNKIIPKDGAEVIATISDGEKEYPLIVTWTFGRGRAMAFASDCSPHWAQYFQPWEHYGQFWCQAIKWLGSNSARTNP
ncbi:glutamine amidotransferase [Biomaibacter acetigenes]|nr:glutamine amidotransferase [Biomaibacter acetigenes]